tara:strand:+ start:1052 stop:1312 length:261 start_codon:yes stop_codon:yes gene_type:complete
MSRMKRFGEMLQQVVDDINACLNENAWSPKQLKHGKNFVIHRDWLPLSSTLVKKYRGAGWIVKLNVEVEPGQRQYVLNIKHPETSV